MIIMNSATDLKSTRLQKGLTQEDLAQNLLGVRPATLAAIENGLSVPHRTTRARIESILGEIDWLSTLAADRGHIGYALQELINADAPGVDERLRFCRQYLQVLETLTEKI